MKKKRVIALIFCLLSLVSLCACGKKAGAESITVLFNGENADKLELLVGDEGVELTAVVLPEECTDAVMWDSDDDGVIKPTSTGDRTCTLSVKKTGRVKLTVTCGECSTTIKLYALKNQDKLAAREVAVSIDGVNYSSEKLTLYYADQITSFMNSYGDYAMYYGLDTSNGIYGLGSQSCSAFDTSHSTWRDYFLDAAMGEMVQIQCINAQAEKEGVVLGEEEISDIEKTLEKMRDESVKKGFSTVDEYYESLYGAGITEELYRDHIMQIALAQKMYKLKLASLSFTDEELKEHYIELGYDEGEDYNTRVIRVILIPVEKDENGEITEKAVEEARVKTQGIYDEFLAGDMSEESFAALSDEYSYDNTAGRGGLYEDICEGSLVDVLDEYVFGERVTGDNEMFYCDSNGINDYFIVYYVGEGRPYSSYVARSDFENSAINEWMSQLTEGKSAESGPDINSVG